jgi:hypothetical protein
LETSLGGKWIELLSEIAPGLKRAAIMFNPDLAPASAYVPSLETAARSLKVVPIIAPIHSDGETETAITALGREPGGGLVVIPDFFTTEHRASQSRSKPLSCGRRNITPSGKVKSRLNRPRDLIRFVRCGRWAVSEPSEFPVRMMRRRLGRRPNHNISNVAEFRIFPDFLHDHRL